MTTTEKMEGHPIQIGTSGITGPQWLLPWVRMVETYTNSPMGSYSPLLVAAETVNALINAGWTAPNDPDNVVDDAESSEADIAAREVADLVWRATTCPDDQKPGIQALTVEALQRYRKTIV